MWIHSGAGLEVGLRYPGEPCHLTAGWRPWAVGLPDLVGERHVQRPHIPCPQGGDCFVCLSTRS